MRVKAITSRNNPSFKEMLSLLSGPGVKKAGMTLLSGPKQVREVLEDFPQRCGGLVLTGQQEAPGIPGDIPLYRLNPELFRQIDVFGTNQPLLLVRCDPLPLWNRRDWPQGCTLFVPFQDPSNVGAVIRSAAAFGVARVILLKGAAHPFHPKSFRVAGSNLFRIPLVKGPGIDELAESDVPVITLSTGGLSIGDYRFPRTFGLLPGLEGPGLPEACRHRPSVGIPMEPGVESLNAALATGIALYVWKSSAVKGNFAGRGPVRGAGRPFRKKSGIN